MEGLIAFIAGLCVMLIVTNINPPNEVVEYKAAMEQCQKELPRNQVCEITAIPVNQGE